MKKTEKVPSHLNQIITYGLLLLASVIIGLFSPHGMLKSILTLLFMFISTYGIQTAVVAIKPLISNATRYGKKQLKKSNLIDRKMMNINIIEGDAISTGMILLGFLQIFVINYFIQRYTGIQLLDGYIIMFWALLQLGIRITNYFFRYKTGEKLQDIKLLTNVISDDDNKGRPKINITLSAIAVVILILVLKNNPFLVETPESYLEKAEDMILGVIMPDKKIEKYKTRI